MMLLERNGVISKLVLVIWDLTNVLFSVSLLMFSFSVWGVTLFVLSLCVSGQNAEETDPANIQAVRQPERRAEHTEVFWDPGARLQIRQRVLSLCFRGTAGHVLKHWPFLPPGGHGGLTFPDTVSKMNFCLQKKKRNKPL